MINRFIITDVLVWGGESLVGITVTERTDLLNSFFEFKTIALSDVVDDFLNHTSFAGINGILKAKFYNEGFQRLHQQVKHLEMCNGLLIRPKDEELPDLSTKQKNDHLLCPKKRFIIF